MATPSAKPASEFDLVTPDENDGTDRAFRFGDMSWRVAPAAAGQRSRNGSINWRFRIAKDAWSDDPKHRKLLHSLKILVWTMLYDPRESTPMSTGNLAKFRSVLNCGARWMLDEGFEDFSGFTNEASARFLEFFLTHHEDGLHKRGRPPQITYSSANSKLSFVAYVYRQRRALARWGLNVPNEAPFDGKAIEKIVIEDLDLPRGGKLKPISDTVAIAMLTAAERLLSASAEDVIRLQSMVREAEASEVCGTKPRSGELGKYARSAAIIGSFNFSTLEGETAPWASLEGSYTRTLRDGRTGTISGRQALRRLITDIAAACIVCLQGSSGMRASDIAGLKSMTVEGELPTCVRVEKSDDGMLDLFYCIGIERKVTKAPHEWLIGSRLSGTDYLPPPVRALSVLHRLFAPWRSLGGIQTLFVTFSASQGLPQAASSVGLPTSSWLSDLQKDFLIERCATSRFDREDVEKFIRSPSLRGHMWRTTFAIFLYRIDPRLLGPLSRHFGHLRAAYTEAHYIGNDVELLDLLDSSASQESARFFYEAIEGGQPLAGQLASAFDEFPLPRGSSIESYETVVTEEDLRLIDFDYGVCGVAINPEASKCNELGGTTSWSRRSPNTAFREASTCLGCPLFAASTRHLPFWASRKSRLEGSVAEYTSVGRAAPRILVQRLAAANRMVITLQRSV